jgi:hypothetical protein
MAAQIRNVRSSTVHKTEQSVATVTRRWVSILPRFDDGRFGSHAPPLRLRKLGEFVPGNSVYEFVLSGSPIDMVLADGEISVEHFVHISFERDSGIFDFAFRDRKLHTCSQRLIPPDVISGIRIIIEGYGTAEQKRASFGIGEKRQASGMCPCNPVSTSRPTELI